MPFAANETLQSLQTRKEGLEQELKRLGERQTPTVRKVQEDILDVMFQIECLNVPQPAMLKRSVAKRSVGGGGAAPKELVEVTTYYATNRKRTDAPEPVKTYGSNYEGNFHYGRAVVSIPKSHKPGEVEKPNILMRLIVEPDPSKHFVLKSVTPLDLDAARKEMSDKLKESPSKAMLVYVHGYNSGFGDAAMRAAQIAYDLNFQGMPFFYSWPSAARVRAYLPDEESRPAVGERIRGFDRGPDVQAAGHRHLYRRAQHGHPRGQPRPAAPRREGQAEHAAARASAGRPGYQRRAVPQRDRTEAGRHAGPAHHGLRILVGPGTDGIQGGARLPTRRRDDGRRVHLPRHRDDRRQLRVIVLQGARPFLRGRHAIGNRRHPVHRAEPRLDQAAWADLQRSRAERLLEVPVMPLSSRMRSEYPGPRAKQRDIASPRSRL